MNTKIYASLIACALAAPFCSQAATTSMIPILPNAPHNVMTNTTNKTLMVQYQICTNEPVCKNFSIKLLPHSSYTFPNSFVQLNASLVFTLYVTNVYSTDGKLTANYQVPANKEYQHISGPICSFGMDSGQRLVFQNFGDDNIISCATLANGG